MNERPSPEDLANKAERDAAYLDEWRWEKAGGGVSVWLSVDHSRVARAITEYRRLVREGITPDVEA